MERSGKCKLSRRKFLKLAGGAVAAAVAGGVIDALLIEPRWIKVTHPVVAIPDLPAGWDGARIAHLTDLHVGHLNGLDYIRHVVQLANGAEPDLVVLTGDFVNTAGAADAGLSAVLGRLSGKAGVFAVLGNHDYWAGARAVKSCLARARIAPLTNAHRILLRNGQGLCLAGVDDSWAGRPDLHRALGDMDRRDRQSGGRTPRVLMCHNPDYAEELPDQPRADLMLAGHTHGGQIKLPFGPRPKLPIRHTRYAAGLVQGPKCQVYTSVGVGMIGIPVRFNCRPELAMVTLRRA